MNIVIAGSAQANLNRAMAGWLEAKLGLPRSFREPYSTMGVFFGEHLIAVLIYENYRPEDGTVEIGMAATSRRWLNRTVMQAMADFVFGDLGCQMAVFRTSERNEEANRLMSGVGFERIVLPRMRGRDEAEHLFYLTDDRWNQNRLNSKGKIDG